MADHPGVVVDLMDRPKCAATSSAYANTADRSTGAIEIGKSCCRSKTRVVARPLAINSAQTRNSTY